MKHFFYPRLALTNIKKNAKIYIPYLLTSMFTVMMFYIMQSLASNTGFINDPNSSGVLLLILELGVIIIVIFAIIFLFYINSFLMKRRKKEIALYNILGMEKKHVMIMMLCETLMTTFVSIVGGLVLGVLFSKLVYLCLVNLIHISTSMAFEISTLSIVWTLILFIPIYLIAYLFNVIQIKLSNPIELLRGSQSGEKEPKAKWIMTLIGLMSLIGGYYIAQTVADPMTAIMFFFLAVILVIVGTYCLFTAGSITILKLLKKNKNFYYKTSHFTAISQMIYRMKQNAVGLASICILYTCILVMLSSTISLYTSIGDTATKALDHDIELDSYFSKSDQTNDEDRQDIYNEFLQVKNELISHDIELEQVITKESYSIVASQIKGGLKIGRSNSVNYSGLNAMTVEQYNQSFQTKLSLEDDEVYVAKGELDVSKTITLEDKSFKVKGIVKDMDFLSVTTPGVASWVGVVFSDEKVLQDSLKNANQILPNASITMMINLKNQDDEKEATELINKIYDGTIVTKRVPSANTTIETRYFINVMFTEMYGSLFFLGIFLGVLFLMAAILIMYYKQLNEGYEDKKRFEIMQNVGMSKKEVKQSIRSQVLIFFFLPLAVSVLHMGFAFNLIVRLFGFLVMSGESLFIICTLTSVGILTIIYSIVYSLTAKTYYKIVKN